jgi:phage FluMu gp28-like protein
LKDIFHIGLRGDLIAFQTEYECLFVDEADAYFPWDLVLSGSDSTLRIYKHYPEGWEAEGDVSIGVDLAKERDSTVFTIVEHLEVLGKTIKVVRYLESTQADYDEQFNRLGWLVRKSRARRVSIDATGPGQMFAEKARKEGFGSPCSVETVNFTNAKKEKWATTFKGDLQLDLVKYPAHPELMSQIHGIKRTKTENNFFKFAGLKDDYFWSLMLALYGEGYVPVTFHRL